MIIHIPEDEYQNILFTGKASFRAANAIEAGTLLPKEHGDLVDLQKLMERFWDGNSMEITKDDLRDIRPIIPASEEMKHAEEDYGR